MHMHLQALCHNCNRLFTYTTPIPNILILSEMCSACGWNDLVGWDVDRVCQGCQKAWLRDVENEMHDQGSTLPWFYRTTRRKSSDGP